MPSNLTMKLEMDFRSVAAVMAAIDGVKEGVKNRVLKQAIGKAARAGARTAKSRAPRGYSGLLKSSIGTKYKSYHGGAAWVYVIGARKDFEGLTPGVPTKNGGITMRKHLPYKIAHLAESGRKALQSKPGKVLAFYTLTGRAVSKKPGGRVRARTVDRAVFTQRVAAARGFHFMQAGYATVQAMKGSVATDIIAGIYREAAKYAAKGKSIYV